ncbi:MAG: hypothetical protein CL963_03495 [Euryarchaeota archaeon]|jgi:hypothetical protein|nr:hypothetical protein [Euryarchaeota archaeon]MAF89542.1 hypothetical protein [Euryarchaeota archaeon]|tara:strand:- start:12180 stop:12671 length:492 start_codon:yes stop_codon:yes gene_type:complete
MGKGSSPRPFSISQQKFADNYEACFGKKESNPDLDDLQRVRYRAHPETGEMIPDYMWRQFDMMPKPKPKSHFIIGEIDPYQSPIDDRIVNTRKEHLDDLKRHGCRHYEGFDVEQKAANEWQADRDKEFDASLQKSFEETYMDLKYQRVEPADHIESQWLIGED